MFLAVLGGLLLILGGFAAANSLTIVRRAVRVWPRPIDRRGGEAMASYEFLVRFIGLMVALLGMGLLLAELFRG
jgi:hypothetical protein